MRPLLGSALHPPPELTADPVWPSAQDTVKTREDVGSSAALSDPRTRPCGPEVNLGVGEHGLGVQCGRGSPQQQMLGKPASYLGEIQLASLPHTMFQIKFPRDYRLNYDTGNHEMVKDTSRWTSEFRGRKDAETVHKPENSKNR